jgi:ribosomal protein S18 acetylase RimI-like enzyme
MVIREASLADLPQMRELWDEFMAFHEDLDPIWVRKPGAVDTWVEFISGLISEEDSLVLVAEEDSLLAGQMVAKMQDTPPVFIIEQYGFIQEVVVRAGFRRRGVARLLYDHAENWLREKGAVFLRTNIDANNALSQGFFRSAGFGPYTVTWQKRLKTND